MKKSTAGILAATALLLTILSGETTERLSSYHILFEGVNPGFDTVRVTVGGWPLPFLEDRLSTSPVGSVDMIGGLVGADNFRVWPFLADVALYLVLLIILWTITKRLIYRSRHQQQNNPGTP